MNNLINLTPHNVTIIKEDGNNVTVPSQGVARVSCTTTQVALSVEGIPLVKQTMGEVEGIPDQRKDIYYIVSRMVAAALPERMDLVVPADLVRDDKGIIIGCKKFETLSNKI